MAKRMMFKNALGPIKNKVADAFQRLRAQTKAFRANCAERSYCARSQFKRPPVQQPDWQLIIVVTISAVLAVMLILDEPAMVWTSTVSKQTYHLFRAFTELGKSEYMLIPAAITILGLGLFSWDHVPRSAKAVLAHLQMAGLFVFVAIAGSGLSNNLIKMAIGRARPRHFDDLGAFHFAPPGLDSGLQSFPSGHSATAGAMAIIFILFFPRLKWTWLAIAGWIGASRVIVGAHYPSDVIAGLVYGASFAWLLACWFTNRRLLFRSHDGCIRLSSRTGLSPSKIYKSLHMLAQKP